AALLGKPERGRYAGVRDRDDDVRFDGLLDGEALPQILAGPVDVAAEDLRIGPREIDELEDALPAPLRRDALHGSDRLRVGDDHFARLHLADELRLDQVERARLAREHGLAAQVADEERAEAERIADGDDRILGEEEQRIGAAHAGEGRLDPLESGPALLPGDEVEQELGIARSLEDRALGLELGADLLGVDEVPVVGDRDGADRAAEVERLRV